MAILDKVSPDKDIQLLLLLRVLWSLCILHARYEMLHFLKIYLILHKHLELLSDDHSNLFSLCIIA